MSDLDHLEPALWQAPRMTNLRMRELFAQFDATTKPCDGNAPSRELAESGRQEVFREFLWRMHNHPSPEVRYWSCYWLIWERTPCAEFIEVLQKSEEYPRSARRPQKGSLTLWIAAIHALPGIGTPNPLSLSLSMTLRSKFAGGPVLRWASPAPRRPSPTSRGWQRATTPCSRLVVRRGRGRGRALEHRGQSPFRSSAFWPQHLVLGCGQVAGSLRFP